MKMDAKKFAFNNKGLIWRALWLLYFVGIIGGLITGFIYVFSEGISDGLDSMFSVLTMIITPVVTVTFYTYITKILRGEKVTYESELETHKKNWWNYTCTYFMTQLFVALWTLLFIIPGVVKALEYSQVMYIQSENPDMQWKECLEKSKKMMYGHKMELFSLELSFVGWFILSFFTMGIALIWVIPYYQITLLKYHQALSGVNLNFVDAEVVEHQPSSRKCPYCGSDIPEGSNYCSNCGSINE